MGEVEGGEDIGETHVAKLAGTMFVVMGLSSVLWLVFVHDQR